jgi:hypothetical protein
MLSVVIAVLYGQVLASGILGGLTYWTRREKLGVVLCKIKAKSKPN